MKLFSLTVGIEKTADGSTLDNTEKKLDIIREHLVSLTGGYTETATHGGWKNSAGEIVSESGRRFDVVCDDAKPLLSFARAAAAILKQESVLVTVTETTALFIGQ